MKVTTWIGGNLKSNVKIWRTSSSRTSTNDHYNSNQVVSNHHPSYTIISALRTQRQQTESEKKKGKFIEILYDRPLGISKTVHTSSKILLLCITHHSY